jgi:hypothetical protein
VDPALVLEAVSTFALVGGLLFAGFQWRSARGAATRDAQLLLLHSFESPEFTRAMRVIAALPDGISKTEIEELGEDHVQLIWYWGGQIEGIGQLVNARSIPIGLVDEMFGGPILITWRRLSRFATDVRTAWGRDAMWEWYQWLAEQLAKLESEQGRIPAYEREADWKP